MSKYIIGITGASGSIYAVRLLEVLLAGGHEAHLVVTDNGRRVLSFEMDCSERVVYTRLDSLGGSLKIYDVDDIFAPIASGSFKTDGMVVIPCSMSTLGEISCGTSKNLLGRAADVCIKEKRKLVLVPRETPLSSIHLKNMLCLSEAGVTILPAMPAFYNKPVHIEDMVDFVAGRVLSSLGIENKLYKEWGGQA